MEGRARESGLWICEMTSNATGKWLTEQSERAVDSEQIELFGRFRPNFPWGRRGVVFWKAGGVLPNDGLKLGAVGEVCEFVGIVPVIIIQRLDLVQCLRL